MVNSTVCELNLNIAMILKINTFLNKKNETNFQWLSSL